MSDWVIYDNGASVGTVGGEGDVILRDEENSHGARMTLKHGKDHISVSCNIYGRIDHTRFFGQVSEAQREYLIMRTFVSEMMNTIQSSVSDDIKVWEVISEFVRRFP